MQYVSQTVSIPLCFSTITSLIGILVSSRFHCALRRETLWSPLDVLGRFLDDYSSGAVPACFPSALPLPLPRNWEPTSVPNSHAFGTDVTASYLSSMNIRRGSYLLCSFGLGCPAVELVCRAPPNSPTYLSGLCGLPFRPLLVSFVAITTTWEEAIWSLPTCTRSLLQRTEVSPLLLHVQQDRFELESARGVHLQESCPTLLVLLALRRGEDKVPIGAIKDVQNQLFVGFSPPAYSVCFLVLPISPIEGTPSVKPFEKGLVWGVPRCGGLWGAVAGPYRSRGDMSRARLTRGGVLKK